jgi:hypothetical protein
MPALGNTMLFRTPARLYDPEAGVFTSRDPLLYADSPSPYAYAAHNPVDFADPAGLDKKPLGNTRAAGSASQQPSFGERLAGDLGGAFIGPFMLYRQYKTAKAMYDAFAVEAVGDEEKNIKPKSSVGGGLAMAANVQNPLYHGMAAQFESKEAAERGEYVNAYGYALQAQLGYLQTLAMAVGMARGFKTEPTPAPTPESALRDVQNDYVATRAVGKDYLLERERNPWVQPGHEAIADSSVQFRLSIRGLEGDKLAESFANDLLNKEAMVRAMQNRFSPPPTPIFWEANWGPRPDLQPDWFIKLP